MWNLHGIEPEVIDYTTMRVVAGTYHLRPEIIESTYYLHHYTKDRMYRQMGEAIFNDFVKHCRTQAGYAALSDIVTKQQRDEMESFALAETFKILLPALCITRHFGFRQYCLQHGSTSASPHLVSPGGPGFIATRLPEARLHETPSPRQANIHPDSE